MTPMERHELYVAALHKKAASNTMAADRENFIYFCSFD